MNERIYSKRGKEAHNIDGGRNKRKNEI